MDYNLIRKIIVTPGKGDKLYADIQRAASDIDDNGNITLHFQSTITKGEGKFAAF